MWTSSLRWPAHQDRKLFGQSILMLNKVKYHQESRYLSNLSNLSIGIESIESIYLSNYLLLLYLICIKVRHQLTCRQIMSSWNLGSYWQMTFALFSFSLLAVWCNPGVDRPLLSELVPSDRRGKVIGWWPLCSNWGARRSPCNLVGSSVGLILHNGRK